MLFVLNRNRTYASTMGHSIEFKKGEPTYVPPALWAEVQTIGAVPEEEIPEDETVKTNEPTDPHKRTEDILAAIELVATRNTRDDFGANGSPHVRALAVVLGWKPTPQERDLLWARFQVDGKE